MKILKYIVLVIAVSFVFSFFGCQFILPVNANDSTSIENDLSESITAKELLLSPYMGGSLFFNPDSPATGAIQDNAIIAIRLGKLNRLNQNEIPAKYSDNEQLARYGYIKIVHVDSQSIALTATLYDFNANIIINECPYNISKGEYLDIDSDGNKDIEYITPKIKRPGLENAVYLSFICDSSTESTAMFSILRRQYSRSALPSGLIGINPFGQFIISKYENNSATKSLTTGLIEGDFVVNESTGKVEVVNRTVVARAVNDSDTINYQLKEDDNILFTDSQFIDGKSALDLCSELPNTIFASKDKPSTNEEAILLLNELLKSRTLLSYISQSQKTEIPDDELIKLLESIKLIEESRLIYFNRNLLCSQYPDTCPDFTPPSNDVMAIIPYASCRIGNSYSENYPSEESLVRAISIDEYNQKMTYIEDIYKDYTTLVGHENFNRTAENSIYIEKFKIKLGAKGKFDLTGSSLSTMIEGAIFLQADTRFQLTVAKKIDLYSLDIMKYEWATIPILGPIVLKIQPITNITIPLEINGTANVSQNMRYAFTGIYGYGVGFDAFWWLSWNWHSSGWWCIGYWTLDFQWNGGELLHSKVSETAIFSGFDTKPANLSFANAFIAITPMVKYGFGSSIDIGTVNVAGASITMANGLDGRITISNENNSALVGKSVLSLIVQGDMEAHVGITIPVINQFLGARWPYEIVKRTIPIIESEIFRYNY